MKKDTKASAKLAIELEQRANQCYARAELTIEREGMRIAPCRVGDILTVRDAAHRLIYAKVHRICGILNRVEKRIEWRAYAWRCTTSGKRRGGEVRIDARNWGAFNKVSK